MQNVIKTFVASASELQSSDLYMTAKMIMFTVPSANLNGVRCTEDFLDEIVENQDKYVGLPLCADVVNLVKGRYEKLGHCYNPKTGTFSSSIIGSFYKFEKEELKNGEVALIGYARILKRNKKVCKAVSELFADDNLKFSFEISCGSYEELDDDTILIDKADNNYIEGMCIVSFPACPTAVARELVAEINGIGKEADQMTEQEMSAEVIAEETVVESAAEETTEEVVAEENVEETAQEDPTEEVVAEEAVTEELAEEQTAEVYVHVNHTEIDEVHAYDNETGESTTVRDIHEEHVSTRIEVEDQDKSVAETEVAETETAESENQEESETDKVIAELRSMIEDLKREIAELKKPEVVVASEKKEEEVVVNPFIAEIVTEAPYKLLEKAPKSTSYSLLERA